MILGFLESYFLVILDYILLDTYIRLGYLGPQRRDNSDHWSGNYGGTLPILAWKAALLPQLADKTL